MKTGYDCIIIGAGCGGAAMAALMGSRGRKTLVLEQNSWPGGRMSTLVKDGFFLDHGHVLMRAEKGPHGEVLRRAGAADLIPRFSHSRNWDCRLRLDDLLVEGMQDVRAAVFSPKSLKMLSRFKWTFKDFIGFLLFALRHVTITQSGIRKADHMDCESFLTRYTSNKYFLLFNGACATVGLGALLSECSAGEMIRIGLASTRDRMNMGYPMTGEGIAAVPKSFLRAAARLGAEICMGTPVQKILVRGGKAQGVLVNGKEISSKIVISNAELRRTVLDLAGREHFPSGYVDRIKGLKYSYGGLSLKYALKEKVTDSHWGGVVPDGMDQATLDMMQGRVPAKFPLMYVSPSLADPSLAPRGTQSLSFITGCPAVEPGTMDWGPWIARMKEQAEELFPGIAKNTLFCEATTPDDISQQIGRTFGDSVGVAQTVDQVGRLRPHPLTPVKNLFVVGADVGLGQIASERASQSALDLFEFLRRKF